MCNYDPRVLAGQPIGMFHCLECGEMVVAGLEHPDYSVEPEQIYPTYPEVDTNIVCTCGITWRWAQHELERCPGCGRVDDPF